MKRYLQSLVAFGLGLLVGLGLIGIAWAQGVTLHRGQQVSYKIVPRHWDFPRGDESTLTVLIDPNGTLTLLEDGVYIGTRYDSCTVAD